MSHWNEINEKHFQELKEKRILAVIHKATEGKYIEDEKYALRKTLAQSKGFLWGSLSCWNK